MEETKDDSDYVSWFSHLLPSCNYVWVVVAAAGVSIGLFALGYVVYIVGGVGGGFDYLLEPEGYLAAFSVFWMLTWLGLADGRYVDVWNDVRPAFAVDEESYRAIVQFRLKRIYDLRRILGYTAALAAPYLLFIAVLYYPGAPFQEETRNVFLTVDSPYDASVARVIEFYLFGIVNDLLLASVINGFLNHLALVREVAELPFQNIYTSASDLEPVGRFTIASSTVWFTGISLIVLWIGIGVSSAIGVAMIALLIFAGLGFFLAPQLAVHDALTHAKRETLAEIRERYEELYQSNQMESQPSEDVMSRLELIDRQLANAKSIRTWVYDLSSISKLVAASMIPWLQLFVSMGRLLS